MPEPHRSSRFRHLISSGISEPLSSIPFHRDAPLERRRMAGWDLHPSANLHVAVHEIRAVPHVEERSYCLSHTHDCAELNLLIAFERLVFRFTLGDEEYIQAAPASVFIPAGLPHSANVIEGSGFFVVILASGDYQRSLVGAPSGPGPI